MKKEKISLLDELMYEDPVDFMTRTITEEEILLVISKVNSSLCNYSNSECSSIMRSSFTEKERCLTFEHYIENRFNFEAAKIPRLRKAIFATDGHLFKCTCLFNPNFASRKFEYVIISFNEDFERFIKPEVLLLFGNSIVENILGIPKFLGGTEIKFNSVKMKIKYTIR